ncbi:uncharacterized protein LOC135824197 [Sycon ciliatum]|uniref:uncharacterized protein LOC135824197 n=1 Tax=Sycon ciliatum TaxID=27933 RepID=UPI0031F6B9FB
MSEIIVKRGQLEKEGGTGITRWQSRTFILTRTSFSWFKPDDLRSALGKLELGEIAEVKRQLGESGGKKNILTVSTQKKVYKLAAPSKEEQTEWITALHPSTQASYAAKTAAATSTQAQKEPVQTTEHDEKVLAALKAAAKQMTGSDGSDRRSTILLPINTESTGGEGAAVLSPTATTGPDTPSAQKASSVVTSPDGTVVPAVTSPSAGQADSQQQQQQASAVKYAVAEVFITHGLRISGPVTNQMFNMLGQGVPTDKKRSDPRGWYCDRSFTLCSVIQMFVTSGWTLYRLSHSTSATPWEPGLFHPINLAVFARGPGIKPLCMSESESRQFTGNAATGAAPSSRAGGLSRSGTVRASVQQRSASVRSGGAESVTGLLPSEEAELRVLMEEFSIPLELLDVKVGA